MGSVISITRIKLVLKFLFETLTHCLLFCIIYLELMMLADSI